MFTKYGIDNIIVMLTISVVLIGVSFFISKTWIQIPLIVVGVLLAAFTFWFFRDPDRTVPSEALNDESLIVSPADGTVVQIKEIYEEKYMKCDAVQISIFLSPLNVHVNRIPISGVIEYFKYNPGKYLVAYHPKSSELNEQTYIGLRSKYAKILFKQIVGIVARRLVWDIKEGDTVKIGQRFGMMKFGSRMDVIVSPEAEINVKTGDRVVGAETVIARLKKQ
jgi:phosphatidylserine decarboxylase